MSILKQTNKFSVTNQLLEDKMDEGCLNDYSREEWYTFSPQKTGSYEIKCISNENISLYVYDKNINYYYHNLYKENAANIYLAGTLLDNNVYYLKISCFKITQCFIDYKILVSNIKEPNVPYLEEQWGILNKKNGLDINILPVLKYTKGNAFKIGIADSGIFYNHIELKKNINLELSNNFVHDIRETFPQNEMYSKASAEGGHGTHLAGIIASHRKIVGVAPRSEIISLKVLGNIIKNHIVFNDASVSFIKAIEYSKKHKIKIINCSFCGEKPSEMEKDAMFHAKDTLFIIAAGNNSIDLGKEPRYPACYYLDNSIVVASLNQNGELDKNSNFGGPTDIVAPGCEILSTGYRNSYILKSGTSIAAPFVSAVCSILWSKEKNLSPYEVKKRVTGEKNVTQLECLKGKVLSNGLLNAYKSILYPELDD